MIHACKAADVRTETGMPAEIVMSVVNGITLAEQVDRLRDELFAATAHALKTPVAIIRTASQVLSRTVPSGFDRSTRIIERQSARIDALVDNLLALSRIRSGTLQLHPIDVELAPLLQEVLRGVDTVSDAHDIQVHVDACCRVRADRERLAIVLRNTLQAAVRSSRPGMPLTVRLRDCAHNAIVEVSYALDEAGRAGGGAHEAGEFDELGVGRYVTKAIVERHDGAFTETTDRDRATIQIRLPLSKTGE